MQRKPGAIAPASSPRANGRYVAAAVRKAIGLLQLARAARMVTLLARYRAVAFLTRRPSKVLFRDALLARLHARFLGFRPKCDLVGAIAAEGSCPPAHVCHSYSAVGGSSQCFGRIVERRLLCSPLVVFGKNPKLKGNRVVSHRFGSAQQRLRCLQTFLASS